MRLNQHKNCISEILMINKTKGKSISQSIAHIWTKAVFVYTSYLTHSQLKNKGLQNTQTNLANTQFKIQYIQFAYTKQANASCYDVHLNLKKK